MQPHISMIDASEAHPDTICSRDTMLAGLREATQLISEAHDARLEPEVRLEKLENGLKKLRELNAGPEMVGYSPSTLEALVGSLRRAINPELIHASFPVEPGDPYYV